MRPANEQIKLCVCECESRTARACVQRFVCACVLSVCGYLVCVGVCPQRIVCVVGGSSDSCRGGPGG